MAALDLAYALANYTPADASPVQSNFARTEQYINQELINRDGSVAMQAQLKLVGNPVAPLDAAAKQYVDLLLPIGVILPYGGVAAPGAGIWALANYAELATAAYPELFEVYQYRFGGTPGGGVFNLPPLVGRVPIGAGGAVGTTVGAQGGYSDQALLKHVHNARHAHGASADTRSTDHAHLVTEHTHGGTTGGGGWHDHGWSAGSAFIYNGPIGGSRMIDDGGGGLRGAPWSAAGDHTHTFGTGGASPAQNTGWQSQTKAEWGQANYQHAHGITVNENNFDTDQRGEDQRANSNLPPYVVINYICRVR